MAHAESSEPAGYETRDVRPRGIVLLGGALIAVTGVAMLLLWWLFNRLEARAELRDPPVSPLAAKADRPSGPGLERGLNYRTFEESDRARLKSYGWVDKQQRVVRIPVERAMELLVERGLPEPSGPIETSVKETP
jgi:hypothetical protein